MQADDRTDLSGVSTQRLVEALRGKHDALVVGIKDAGDSPPRVWLFPDVVMARGVAEYAAQIAEAQCSECCYHSVMDEPDIDLDRPGDEE